jgi:hypothetical protein
MMMVLFGISPRALGECGRELYAEILRERLDLKRRASEATDPDEAKALKVAADGMKIVLNSAFGQLGNPYSLLHDPEAMLAVTLGGQLLLIGLLEDLADVGAEILSANTDGIAFRTRKDDGRWQGVLDKWQGRTGMTLEVGRLEALAIVATNSYAAVAAGGKVKRKGTLGDALDWEHVPNFRVVADAVVAALLHGTLPERTVAACREPLDFTAVVRRGRKMAGVLVDDATKAEVPLPAWCGSTRPGA